MCIETQRNEEKIGSKFACSLYACRKSLEACSVVIAGGERQIEVESLPSASAALI
jgi:hypothetical protein